MDDLQAWQYALIALLFMWGGFVRASLGFGGSVLTLPFLLMVHNEPLVFLPLIAVHLLFFSFITVGQSHLRVRREGSGEGSAAVDWSFLRYALALMVVPKLLGVAGVMGLLVGALCCGFCVAVFMANAGGSWDNAKKFIEAGAHGGKGTDAHKAAVVGDTVGDPFKDTSGPSLNILIKLMSMVSVVAAGLIVRYSLTALGIF